MLEAQEEAGAVEITSPISSKPSFKLVFLGTRFGPPSERPEFASGPLRRQLLGYDVGVGFRQIKGLAPGTLTTGNRVPNIPIVILDDATPGAERLLRFGAPEAVVQAGRPEEVPAALARIEAALARGRHVAGWLAYELGYVLEPHLAPLRWTRDDQPLLSFELFGAPRRLPAPICLPPAMPMPARSAATNRTTRLWRPNSTGVHDYIGAGDIYQANLSFRSRFTFAGDPLALYLRLRDRAQAAQGGAYVGTTACIRSSRACRPNCSISAGRATSPGAAEVGGDVSATARQLSDARQGHAYDLRRRIGPRT